MMHRLLLAGLLVLTGCQGLVGPIKRSETVNLPIDDPRFSIEEQRQRERANLALPDASSQVGPPTYAGNPTLRGPYNGP